MCECDVQVLKVNNVMYFVNVACIETIDNKKVVLIDQSSVL